LLKINDMEERDLIIRYLENNGAKVRDCYYYSEESDSLTMDLGVTKGLALYGCYLFGNISITATMSGVTLANKNIVQVSVGDVIMGGLAKSEHHFKYAPGAGFGMLGDGTYILEKRIYGIGFNRIYETDIDAGGTTIVGNMTVNGMIYIFK
jgi:hypothetical protein